MNLFHKTSSKSSNVGMGNYLHTFRENVEQQNLQSLPFLRQKMESFYGQEDFIGHLENLNRKALKRSNTPSSKQEEHTASLNHLGKVNICLKISIYAIYKVCPIFVLIKSLLVTE